MRKLKAVALASALIAGVFGVGGSGAYAQSSECNAVPQYTYCGDHIQSSKLPLRMVYNGSGAPAALSKDGKDLTPVAIKAAMNTWDATWPGEQNPCAPLCYGGSTQASFGSDGINAIVWDSPSRCGGSSSDLAVTCIWHAGTSGAAARRIVEVDVILNSARSWAFPDITNVRTAAGDAFGVAPEVGEIGGDVNPLFANWYDVQSVLTHEMGHAFGLDHVGGARPFPGTLQDAPVYQQTMYRWYYPGTTNKRTLDPIDLFVEQRVAAATYSD